MRHHALAVTSLVTLLVMLPTPRATAGTVSLTGDLGTANWSTPTSIIMNTTYTRPISLVLAGRGLILGDAVFTNNGGTFFQVVVTNLSFQATAPSPLGGITHARLDIVQGFQPLAPNMPYYAEHFVAGNWSTTEGNTIVCDSYQGMLGPNPVWLPQLGISNQGGFPSFGVPLAGANVTNSSPALYGIATTIDFYIDGDGFIDLPSSYESTATEIPAPGACVLMTYGALACLRRRR